MATDRRGDPIRRPPGVSTPCRTPAGCPKGTPEAMKSLTPQHEKTWTHYTKCRATGQWPDDELVREHAGLFKQLGTTNCRHAARAVAEAVVRTHIKKHEIRMTKEARSTND